MLSEYKDILTIKDLSMVLGLGKNTAYELIKTGKIKSIRIGKIHKIPKDWLIEYVMGKKL